MSLVSSDLVIANQLETIMLEYEQVKLKTFHTIHGGIYTRTIELLEGQALVGALIKIPTTLIFNGHIRLLVGDEVRDIVGYRVVSASGMRKQVMTAVQDSVITMMFKTDARTVTEAEDEFTDDAESLMSRRDEAINIIEITEE